MISGIAEKIINPAKSAVKIQYRMFVFFYGLKLILFRECIIASIREAIFTIMRLLRLFLPEIKMIECLFNRLQGHLQCEMKKGKKY